MRVDFQCPSRECQINTYSGIPANIERVFFFINVDGICSLILLVLFFGFIENDKSL